MVKTVHPLNLDIFAIVKPKSMRELEFTLDKEFIELNKLLKILSLVESGGQANSLITDGYVRYNGEVDTRKRLKLRKGDKIEFAETLIRIC